MPAIHEFIKLSGAAEAFFRRKSYSVQWDKYCGGHGHIGVLRFGIAFAKSFFAMPGNFEAGNADIASRS